MALLLATILMLMFGGVSSAHALGGWTATLSPVAPQPVPTGDSLEYTYNVQCSTPTGCGTLTATIPPPPGWTAAAGLPTVTIPSTVTGVSYSAAADGTLTVTWVNPAPGQSNQVQLNWPTVQWTTLPGLQPITATVTDGSTTQKPTATDELIAKPNLSIVKTAPTSISAGSTMTYKILVQNDSGAAQGNLTLTNATIKDALPSGVTYVSCTINGSATCAEATVSGTPTVTFTLPGNFGPSSYEAYVTVKVSSTAAVGSTINNTATVSGTPLGGTTPVSASASASTGVGASGQLPVFDPSKSGPMWVMPGELATYRLQATNSGTTDATFVFTDVIPSSLDVFQIWFSSEAGNETAVVTYSDGSTGTWTNTPGGGTYFSVSKPGVKVTKIVYTAVVSPGTYFFISYNATIVGAAGTTFQNCMDSTGTNSSGTATGTQYCTTTEIRPTVVYGTLYKSVSPTSPVADGAALTWTLKTVNDPYYLHSGALKPYYIDLLPINTTYVAGSFAAATGNTSSCPVTTDFGVTVVPNYLNGRTAVIATTQQNPSALSDGTTITGGSGASIPNDSGTCSYTLQSTVNPGVPKGTYGGTQLASSESANTYPIDPNYAGNDAYMFAPAGDTFIPLASGSTWQPADAGDVNKNGNTAEGMAAAVSDFQVSQSAALNVAKLVKGDQNTSYLGSAEVDPTQYGTSTPGGTVNWQVTLGNNGNVPITNYVAYDLLPADNIAPGATGYNSGVTAVRYTDTSSSASYQNQWIPTMTGPLTVAAGDPVTILYSTNPNPCRPEMSDPSNSVAAVYCGGTTRPTATG
ncbi:MAG: hypothetical protein WAV45_05355 [Propionibacteriaceae bacterium]|nr:isopeptide-forming domain-containing fimbrial protein [Micropruina sp.]